MSLGELRVLIVDDSPEDAELLLRELARAGFDPVHRRLESEVELIDALQDAPWDVVVCDWVMPRLSAKRAIEVVNESAFEGVIIVVSGSMGEEHVVDAMRAGAHDYIVKDNLHRLVPALQRELREAEVRRAARRGEQELRRQALIVENIHDGIITFDLEDRIVAMNPAAEELTGYTTEEVLGHQPEFLGGGDAGQEATLRRAIAEGMEREGRFFGEVTINRKDGTQRVSELVVVPLRDERGDVLGSVGVNRDITERKQAEDKLRDTIDQLRETDRTRRHLLSRLISAQEEERLRMAGEIHDDPVQQLFAASIRLGMLGEQLTDPKHLEIHSKAQTLVDTTISRLRRMLFELQPRSLETEGLGAALGEYIAYANDEGETRFSLEDRLTETLSQDMRTVAYRIVLEGLSNVRKHAAATIVKVTIQGHEDGVLCTVIDDGRGFMLVDMAEYQPGHLGVPAMRERVELAGGRFEIRSAPGEGTTVEFWLPAA